jgi:hypothetical protein
MLQVVFNLKIPSGIKNFYICLGREIRFFTGFNALGSLCYLFSSEGYVYGLWLK